MCSALGRMMGKVSVCDTEQVVLIFETFSPDRSVDGDWDIIPCRPANLPVTKENII